SEKTSEGKDHPDSLSQDRCAKPHPVVLHVCTHQEAARWTPARNDTRTLRDSRLEPTSTIDAHHPHRGASSTSACHGRLPARNHAGNGGTAHLRRKGR